MAYSVDALVLSKSLALVEKTKRRVKLIDGAAFPTISSEKPRDLLLAALDSLGDKGFWKAMNPEAFYHVLIELQDLVAQVETSTSEHISWPLVSYCDYFWKLLFPSSNPQIFYSVYKEHNYGIASFTQRLKSLLDPVLPPAEIARILNDQEIYCLQIASLEDENLPLYANIGHEFGHALFWSKASGLRSLLSIACQTSWQSISQELTSSDVALQNRRRQRCVDVIIYIATELFCDLAGILIAGPAFLLSLHEMGWGVDQNSWNIKLTLKHVQAYPSFAFRLCLLKKILSLSTFENDLQHRLANLPQEKVDLKSITSYINGIVDDHPQDRVLMRLNNDRDSTAIQHALEKHLPALKTDLEQFCNTCWNTIIFPLASEPDLNPVQGEQVFELLRRLDAHILPNIIPNGTLLGTPASFATILNASALFRMHILATRKEAAGSEELNGEIQKAERLTAKAFEVSYIQRDFNLWKAGTK